MMAMAVATNGSEETEAAAEGNEGAEEDTELGPEDNGGELSDVDVVESDAAGNLQSAISSYQAAPCVAMCTLKGRIKRVALSQFASIRSSGLICMSLSGDDQLSYVRLTLGNGELILVTAQGQALRFDETLVRRMGRTASGVRAMRLKRDGDYIAGMEVVEPGGFLLTVTERGYGKCTPLDEYPAKGRGGGGVRTLSGTLDVTGLLVAALVVQPNDQITIISANAVALRQKVSDIPQSGRATRGSRLINLRDGDAVASVARLADVSQQEAVGVPA
jgi:DNA gyrase subunit A